MYTTPKMKLFIATPMFGGMCFSHYMLGMLELFGLCSKFDVPVVFYGVTNASLITQARNECAYHFMQSDCTHLLFIDADIGFTAKEGIALLECMAKDTENKYDVLSGAYPKKEIYWDNVKLAVEQGLIRENPADLAKYGGKHPLGMSAEPISSSLPIETTAAYAGFMIIPRRTLTRFTTSYPEQLYMTLSGQTWHAFFDCIIDPKTQEFLSEDVMFCQYVRNMGGRVWTLPSLELSHQGSYLYEGYLPVELENPDLSTLNHP